MIRLTELKLPLDHGPDDLSELVCKTLGVEAAALREFTVFKRSIDARKRNLLRVFIVHVELVDAAEEARLLEHHHDNAHVRLAPDTAYRPVARAPSELEDRPVVVGFGPCGMLSALVLAQMGFRPIVLERGTTVRQRTKDTWGLWRKNVLNPESNVQFGEGGAGTFSDGKLYSQIKDKRYLGRKVMREFVEAGAPADILVEAHPHIGTFKLVKVVENMREQILALGGEIRFQQRVVDVHIDENRAGRELRGLSVLDVSSGETYELATRHAVMALGHSARDTFAMLFERGVEMHAKPFSIGFRIEHPQSVIDQARWGRHAGHPDLAAASYKLVHHAANGRTVYSFCMCPGGMVVAATSEVGRVVTNGMSQHSRAERNANAGIVVGIEPADFGGERLANGEVSPMAGIALQRSLESHAYVLGGSTYEAPGQLVGDFLADRASTSLGHVEPSYQPGVALGSLSSALPDYAVESIREALPAFAKKLRGFDMPDAVLTGVETRTSSPLRIPRGETFESANVRGLYPAGEGAGYAGGILSAGVDGIRVAEAIAKNMLVRL